MIIGGLQKFSLLDYPEHISAIIFTQGCNFRCQFCYNPMLVDAHRATGKLQITSPDPSGEEIKKGDPRIKEEALFGFLKKRVGKLDAVVVTGGEPTIQPDLPEFVGKIKNLGFKVKLDTNGTNPEVLAKLINSKLLDYIAMDVKANPEKYDLVTGVQPDLRAIKESIRIIKESGLDYEFRTTIVPELVSVDDISQIGSLISTARRWYLQQFKSDIKLVNKQFESTTAYPDRVLEEMCKIASDYCDECGIR